MIRNDIKSYIDNEELKLRRIEGAIKANHKVEYNEGRKFEIVENIRRFKLLLKNYGF